MPSVVGPRELEKAKAAGRGEVPEGSGGGCGGMPPMRKTGPPG